MRNFNQSLRKCIQLLMLPLLFYSYTLNASQSFGENFSVGNDGLGNLVLVWQDIDDFQMGSIIKGATKPSGGGWSTPALISVSGQPSIKPLIQVSSTTGNAVVVWLANDLTTTYLTLMSSTLLFGNTVWSTPVAVSSVTEEQVINDSYAVTLDSNDNIVALWTSYLDQMSGSPIKVMRSASGVIGFPWGLPETLDPL